MYSEDLTLEHGLEQLGDDTELIVHEEISYEEKHPWTEHIQSAMHRRNGNGLTSDTLDLFVNWRNEQIIDPIAHEVGSEAVAEPFTELLYEVGANGIEHGLLKMKSGIVRIEIYVSQVSEQILAAVTDLGKGIALDDRYVKGRLKNNRLLNKARSENRGFGGEQMYDSLIEVGFEKTENPDGFRVILLDSMRRLRNLLQEGE